MVVLHNRKVYMHWLKVGITSALNTKQPNVKHNKYKMFENESETGCWSRRIYNTYIKTESTTCSMYTTTSPYILMVITENINF